jgi:hypothetical protein
MKLEDVDLTRLTPEFQKDDPFIKAFNDVLEPVIQSMAKSMKKLSIWTSLDKLTDEELDNIAWEFNIPWYNNTYARYKKVQIIRSSVELMKRLGTPDTFLTILEDIFGPCELEEAGIDEGYEGEPHHVQIMVANGDRLDKEAFDRLEYICRRVKRASTWIDRVSSTFASDMDNGIVFRMQDTIHEAIGMNVNGYLDYEITE